MYVLVGLKLKLAQLVGVDGFDVDLGESIFESLEVNCQDTV